MYSAGLFLGPRSETSAQVMTTRVTRPLRGGEGSGTWAIAASERAPMAEGARWWGKEPTECHWL